MSVTTPKQKKQEDAAVKIQTEIYLMGDRTPSKTPRQKELEKKLKQILVGLSDSPSDRRAMLNVIKQRATNNVKRENKEDVISPVDKPTSPSDKSLKELFKERLDKGRGSDKFPSGKEAIIAGFSALKRKITGDDKRKKYVQNSKGGSILKKNVEKMAYGGMSGGKRHMYSAGGSVTDNAGLRALKKASPEAYNKIKGIN